MSKVDKSGKRQKTGGRQPGTPNKKSKEVMELLEGMNCNPIEGMALIATDAIECPVCEGTGHKDEESCELCYGSGRRIATLELKGSMYKELAQYVAPKRKPVDKDGSEDERVVIYLVDKDSQA